MLKSAAYASANFMPGDDREWFERSTFWQDYKPVKRGAPKKFKYREPLILCGHGVNIRIDHNTLLVRDGFTHYPQKREQFRFFPGDADLPDRIIVLDGDGAISLHALSWMAEQKIEFLQLNWQGQINNISGNSGYSGNSKIISAQRATKGTKKEAEIARTLISEKIVNSIETLEKAIPKSDQREFALDRLGQKLQEIGKARNCPTTSKMLGIEGVCAQAYFSAWNGLPIKWSGFKRKPIPDNWHTLVPRTMTWRKRARLARHPVNAMLNYGYGVLAHQLKAQVIANGLDPTIGIIHGNSQNPIPLVYDLMEPMRPVVDRQVLEFALSNTFTPGDFTISKWGGCRLNPQLAKVVASKMAEVKFGLAVEEILAPLVNYSPAAYLST